MITSMIMDSVTVTNILQALTVASVLWVGKRIITLSETVAVHEEKFKGIYKQIERRHEHNAKY